MTRRPEHHPTRRWARALAAAAVVFALALLGCPPVALGAQGPTKRFALVVGSPHAGGTGLHDLSYADDDALNIYAWFRAAGVDVEVVTAADLATRAAHPEVMHQATPQPAFEVVKQALRRVVARATAAKLEALNQHQELVVELTFYFSGHGAAGSLLLEDQGLSSAQLAELLLKPTRGLDFVHILIDACGTASVEDFIRPLNLSTNQQAGIVVATTVDGLALEWNDIQSGVLSFEIRSALSGAADLGPSDPAKLFSSAAQPDRGVGYQELGAFIAAANSQVNAIDAKMHPAEQLPRGDLDHPILAWPTTGLGTTYAEIVVPPDVEAWLRVSDVQATEALMRVAGAGPTRNAQSDGPHPYLLAEAHLARRQHAATRIRLPLREHYRVQLLSPQGTVVDTRDYKPADQGFSAAIDALPAVAGAGHKGNAGAALRAGLFRAPYGEVALAHYRPQIAPGEPDIRHLLQKGLPPKQTSSGYLAPSPWPYVFCSTTALTAGLTGLAWLEAGQAYEDWTHAKNEAEYQEQKERTHRWDVATTIGLATTGVAAAACGVSIGFSLAHQSNTSVALRVRPGGLVLGGRF